MFWNNGYCIELLKRTPYFDQISKLQLDCQCRSPKKDNWTIHTKTIYNAKIFWGSRNWGLWPKIRVLLGGTVINTGILIRMLPVFIRGLSGVVCRFSSVEVWLFVHAASSEDILILVQKSVKIHFFWPQFWQSGNFRGKLIGCIKIQTVT